MIEINKKLLALLLVVALLVGAGGVLLLGSAGIGGTAVLTSDEVESYVNFQNKYQKLDQLMSYLEENYYEELDEADLLEGAYAGVYAAAGDEYTYYLGAEALDEYMIDLTGVFYGIGMKFTKLEGEYGEAYSVVPSTPAERAGIEKGDLIIAVNGEDVKELTSTEVAHLIRGDEGTKVTITFERDGVQFDKTITREKIVEPTVTSKMLTDTIGYIQLSQFEEETADQFEEALTSIQAQGAKSFVLDLRDNPGGLTDAAQEIADQLMDKATVVYMQDGNGNKTYMTTKDGRTSMEYVVLINGNTASSSEILATGIKSNREGLIVGTRSYGKGIVQQIVPLSDGTAIKLTIQQYFSPSGEAIHKVGVTPDYEVELIDGDETDYQLEKAIELLSE